MISKLKNGIENWMLMVNKEEKIEAGEISYRHSWLSRRLMNYLSKEASKETLGRNVL